MKMEKCKYCRLPFKLKVIEALPVLESHYEIFVSNINTDKDFDQLPFEIQAQTRMKYAYHGGRDAVSFDRLTEAQRRPIVHTYVNEYIRTLKQKLKKSLNQEAAEKGDVHFHLDPKGYFVIASQPFRGEGPLYKGHDAFFVYEGRAYPRFEKKIGENWDNDQRLFQVFKDKELLEEMWKNTHFYRERMRIVRSFTQPFERMTEKERLFMIQKAQTIEDFRAMVFDPFELGEMLQEEEQENLIEEVLVEDAKQSLEVIKEILEAPRPVSLSPELSLEEIVEQFPDEPIVKNLFFEIKEIIEKKNLIDPVQYPWLLKQDVIGLYKFTCSFLKEKEQLNVQLYLHLPP